MHPRRLLVLPNGDVLVAEQKVGYITLLRDQDGDGKADWIERHAEGFNGPYGLAWRDGDVLVADQDGIWRVPHVLDNLRPGRNVEQRVADRGHVDIADRADRFEPHVRIGRGVAEDLQQRRRRRRIADAAERPHGLDQHVAIG